MITLLLSGLIIGLVLGVVGLKLMHVAESKQTHGQPNTTPRPHS